MKANTPKVRRVPLYPELPWGALRSDSTAYVNGKHIFLTLWDLILFGACLFVAIAIPFEFGVLSWSPQDLAVCPIR